MRVLLIKTSSMGDLLHTLPALTDASCAIPNIVFDWVVEDIFSEIPPWHAAVDQVIPVALRRWRKNIFTFNTYSECKQLYKKLNQQRYDLILDAQGLIKSAFLAWFVKKTPRAGLNFYTARESWASLAYHHNYPVNVNQHAVTRMRHLFSQALHYPLPNTQADFGLNIPRSPSGNNEKYLVFLHGTTWNSKQWPEAYWVQLAKLAETAGYKIKISGNNLTEIERATRIAKHSSIIEIYPYLRIGEMARLLANATGVVAVDTGFGHLAAALNVPTVSLYGPTNPAYTGAIGKNSTHLSVNFTCAPCLRRTCIYQSSSIIVPACYATLTPTQVWTVMSHWL